MTIEVKLLAGYSQIYGEKVSLDDLRESLRRFARKNAAFTLAQINLLLSSQTVLQSDALESLFSVSLG